MPLRGDNAPQPPAGRLQTPDSDDAVLPATGFRLGDRAPLEASPASGSDTDELLTELGYSAGEIAALRRDGAVT